MINFRATAATAALLCLTAFGASPASADGEVNVYTYRETKLIQPLFDAFTKDTGIKVNVVSASSGLEQRMKAEGANSPADVLLRSISAASTTPCRPALPSRSSRW